jgi:FMNH2-dependent dimethyl sulfone monooxygenase
MPPGLFKSPQRSAKTGVGGVPLLGTAEEIAERLTRLSKVGLDGVVPTWFDFNEGIREFIRGVLFLLGQAGVREPRLRPNQYGARQQRVRVRVCYGIQTFEEGMT